MTSDGGDRFLGAPRFDVVLRGYDRRQVDDHIARLQRVVTRLRADLDAAAHSQPLPPPHTPSRGFQPSGYAPPAPRPRPTPRPRPDQPRPDQPQPRSAPTPPEQTPDIVGGFTDRMQSILRAAEEEAAEIRRQARSSARGDDNLRSQVAGLVGERNAMLAELTRMRNQLEGLMPPGARPNPQPHHGAPPVPHPAPPMARPGWGTAADQPPPGGPGPATVRPAPVMSRPPSPPTPPRPAVQPAETDAESDGPVPDVESPSPPASDVAAGRQGMRRFPEGAFRAPGDRADSLRPRSMPDPKPNELFDPTSDDAAEPDHGARQAGADEPVRASGGDVEQTGSATPSGPEVEATVPAPPHTPAAAPSANGATDHHDDPSVNGAPDEPPADEAQPGVTNGVGRPASASWSG